MTDLLIRDARVVEYVIAVVGVVDLLAQFGDSLRGFGWSLRHLHILTPPPVESRNLF